nr:hypothetical protein [uncultured Treponema sp.]
MEGSVKYAESTTYVILILVPSLIGFSPEPVGLPEFPKLDGFPEPEGFEEVFEAESQELKTRNDAQINAAKMKLFFIINTFITFS